MINGHNGSGKTSILTAIQIALFGKRIVTELGSRGGYADFLEGLSSDRNKDTFISLEFKTYTLGKEDIYNVSRRWGKTSKNKFYEELVVYKNNDRDNVLETAWDDFIDTVIPITISSLFFFDGEKIADMATEDGICSLLKTGVQALLGINTLNQLYDDLGYLIKDRLKVEDLSAQIDEHEINKIEDEIKKLSQYLEYLTKEIDLTKVKLDEHLLELAKVNEEFEKTGAKFFYERKNIENEFEVAAQKVSIAIDKLQNIVSEILPLSIIYDSILNIHAQAKNEKESSTAKYISDVLEQWKNKLFVMLESSPSDAISKIEKFFHSEDEKYHNLLSTEHYLNLSDDTLSLLEKIVQAMSQERLSAKAELVALAQAENELERAQRLKSMIPSGDSVKQIILTRENLNEQLSLARDTIGVLERKAEQTRGSLNFKKQEYSRAIRKLAQERKTESIEGRTIRYAQKAQLLIQDLTRKVIEHSRSHLEQLIAESLQTLIRKRGFIQSLRIEDDFSLRLQGYSGEFFDITKLSAGERQLIVISILWGLTKASGRPLPFIIDTPLGRLDSQHRENLLEFYFPDVSHQTILLATDTELTPGDYERLERFISKKYSLQYDDDVRATKIKILQ